MRYEELVEMAEEHIKAVPQGETLRDIPAVEEWTSQSAEMIRQLAALVRKDLAESGGTFGEQLLSVVSDEILSDQSTKEGVKRAVLSPGVQITSLSTHLIPKGGAYVDIRLTTGVLR